MPCRHLSRPLRTGEFDRPRAQALLNPTVRWRHTGLVSRKPASSSPPEPREEQAIKPFFTVASLVVAESLVEQCRGRLCGPAWPGPGMRARIACDPEGNIAHLRETAA